MYVNKKGRDYESSDAMINWTVCRSRCRIIALDLEADKPYICIFDYIVIKDSKNDNLTGANQPDNKFGKHHSFPVS